MGLTRPIRASVAEGGPLTRLDRLRDSSWSPITQAMVASIDLDVYSLSQAAGSAPVYSANPAVSTTIFNSLQTDQNGQMWRVDSVGYNFKVIIPGSAWPQGPVQCRVEIVLSMVGGDKVPLVPMIVDVEGMRSL
jgi:hypothetical protein